MREDGPNPYESPQIDSRTDEFIAERRAALRESIRLIIIAGPMLTGMLLGAATFVVEKLQDKIPALQNIDTYTLGGISGLIFIGGWVWAALVSRIKAMKR